MLPGELVDSFVNRVLEIQEELTAAGETVSPVEVNTTILRGLTPHFEMDKRIIMRSAVTLNDTALLQQVLTEREMELTAQFNMLHLTTPTPTPDTQTTPPPTSGNPAMMSMQAPPQQQKPGKPWKKKKWQPKKRQPWQQNKNKNKKKLLCYNCGKPGHFIKDCWAPRKQQVGQSAGPAGPARRQSDEPHPKRLRFGGEASGSAPRNN
jgi:hypothetical protein